MGKMGWMLFWVLALSWGCSSVQQNTTMAKAGPSGETPEPVVVQPRETQTAPKDPFLDKLDRVEAAYRQLACKANPDWDPMGAVVTIRDPYERLQELVESQSMALDSWRRILKANGFADEQEFYKDIEYIQTARPGWFDQLRGRLMEFVQDCKD